MLGSGGVGVVVGELAAHVGRGVEESGCVGSPVGGADGTSLAIPVEVVSDGVELSEGF